MKQQTLDPVDVEMVRYGLAAAAHEMGVTLHQTSCSPVFNEGNDYSCGILDAAYRLVSHGPTLPVHLGSMAFAVRYAAESFKDEGFEPGDAVLLNDPYRGGTHLPDLTMVSPIFFEHQIIAFAANRAHHIDVGGSVPGSFFAHARENYQEGLRITPIKIFRAGQRDDHVFDLILTNGRLPDQMRMDLESQVSANRTAMRRVGELLQRYSPSVVTGAMDAIITSSEKRTRAVIAEWTDGVYTASDWLDNDGISENPLEIRVTVCVDGDEAVVDFAGSAAQTAGPRNGVLGYVHAGVYTTFQAATDPDIPSNSGSYKPIMVKVPAGTFLNPDFPAPCNGGNQVCIAVHNAVFRALAQVPGPGRRPRVVTCDHGSSNDMIIAGVDPRTKQRYVFYAYPEGGWGSSEKRDGNNATFSITGNTWNMPVEALERRYPLRVERYELRQDSGGAGRQRGGLGIRRDYRLLGHDAEVSMMSTRAVIPPWGLQGGHEGATADYLLDCDTTEARPVSPRFRSAASMVPVRSGQLITQLTAGGGGFGDPAQRDPVVVARDAALGYISRCEAETAYKVSLDDAGAVDSGATAARRGESVER